MGTGMDLSRVLEELRRELQYIDSAILNLERLQAKARRGHRPKLLRNVHRTAGSDLKRPQTQRRILGRHSDT